MKIILGIDPGFAAMGLARVWLKPNGGERVEALGVIQTRQSAKKNRVLASDDNVRRSREIAIILDTWITSDVSAICIESQSWPRNASSCAKVGIAWGVIVAIAQRYGLPILQASPQEIKMSVCGDKKASKGDVQVALEYRYPDLPDWPKPKGIVEHAADALGAVVACLNSDLILSLRRNND